MWEVFVRNKKASVPGNQIQKQSHLREDPENAYWFSGTEAFVLSAPDKENASSEVCCQILRDPGDPVTFIERVEDHHFILCQLEVKDLCVLEKPVCANGFRDCSDTFLDEPAKSDLRFASVILFCKTRQVVHSEICSAGERGSCLNGNSVFFTESAGLFLIYRGLADKFDSQ